VPEPDDGAAEIMGNSPEAADEAVYLIGELEVV
jgi:hypothetical protein